MRVGVTGGSGFIGKRLVDRLLADGYKVRVLTRKVSSSFQEGAEVCVGNLIGDESALRQFVADLDVIYHCAGELSDVSRMRSVHVEGTAQLIRVAGEMAANRKKTLHWVQLSSVGAYGPPKGRCSELRIVTEEFPEAPVGEYEITKTESDALVRAEVERQLWLTATFLRPSNVFGLGMRSRALHNMANMISRGLFFYIGKGDSVATYVHVDDVVDALLLCGFDERAKGEVFVLSNDCAMRDVINAIADMLSVRRPRLCVPEALVRFLVKMLTPWVRLPLTNERVDALVKRTYYPSDHIANHLGFRPKRHVPTAVAELILREQRQRSVEQHSTCC